MTTEGDLPKNGQVQVNLAMQVAGIAARVTSAIRSSSTEKRSELEAKLAQASEQLKASNASPPGLAPFIDVMRGLLLEQDVSELADTLPTSYRAVYGQVLDETQSGQEGEMTLREVLDEVTQNVIVVIKHGSPAQRAKMADTLLKMQQESSWRPDLRAFIDFLQAARTLLLEPDIAPAENELQGRFLEKWNEILDALNE
jgi:hypothetical protein